MAARACKCLKCGNVWVTRMPHSPKQCPECKRKDWDGLHNSYGRLLAGEPAASVTAQVAAVVGVPCTCRLCGGSWVSRSEASVPVQCPKCKKTKWAVLDPFDPLGLLEPGRLACVKCNHTWISKVEGLPRICPACKSDSWCQAAVNRVVYETNNPVYAECDTKWHMMRLGPGGTMVLEGSPVTGIHVYQVNPNNPGFCGKCGWNNITKTQQGVNNPKPIDAAEGERRKRQWELEHPGEKF